jgi:hypothetical protein
MQANVLVLVSAMALRSAPQDPSTCPLHHQHVKELNARGAEAMGFDQETTTHHFRLAPDGGRIEVEANDPADRETKARVVAHLRRIRQQFAEGDFSAPLQTHGEQPPGVPALQRLRHRIRYTFESTPGGGRVLLRTRDAEALEAIHEFLRYQIREHGKSSS